tara:strand:- start:1272 stop:1583 length:312 start_codon:yes stop_codon:yes gene_type:complete
MWGEFLNMTVPALVGSAVTFFGLWATLRNRNKRLEFDIETAQDSVWLDLVKQSRIEYELQRKENNRLRYIVHHLQTELQELESKNSELKQQLRKEASKDGRQF